MKILVCISHVPDTTSKINFKDNNTKFDSNGIQYVINPNDEFGLTRAIWFKEKQGATVDVINVGGPETDPTLRKALAIGADSAIRINTYPKDAFSVSTEISKIAKERNYDLIIAGRESIDYNGGMVPGMIAANIGASFINNCISIEINNSDVNAIRETDGGKETLSTKLPLVIGSQKGLVEESDLKIPNMRGIMMARRKPFTILDPINSSHYTSCSSYEKLASKSAVKMIDSEKIDDLINLLHTEAKVL